MARSGPPAYAWDWFSRQRLLWREARSRLCATAAPAAARYHRIESRPEVIALLRADYGRDPVVRDVVHRVVADVAFVGRTDARFEELGIRNAPRGLVWWWSALTGEEPATDRAASGGGTPPPAVAQLQLDEPPTDGARPVGSRLDEVQQGWGG